VTTVLITGGTGGCQNVTFPPDHGHVSGHLLPMDLDRRPASYCQAIQQLLCLYTHSLGDVPGVLVQPPRHGCHVTAPLHQSTSPSAPSGRTCPRSSYGSCSRSSPRSSESLRCGHSRRCVWSQRGECPYRRRGQQPVSASWVARTIGTQYKTGIRTLCCQHPKACRTSK